MHDDLEELAEMASTRRQLLIALVAGTLLAIGACALFLGNVVPATAFGGLFFGAIFAGAGIGRWVKTPASKLPAVQVLRERPAVVAYVVAMNRGGNDAALLAPPIVLKGNLAKPAQASKGLAADRDDLARALAIVAARSPGVRTASVSDHVGLASPAKLAKTAIANLPA